MDPFSHFDTAHECDRQIDGQAELMQHIALAQHNAIKTATISTYKETV